jgi:hypothetical protein
MTMDKIAEIAAVLNLKSHEGIALEIAERQLEVITKSYEFLSKKENNIIYIADEVGLGNLYWPWNSDIGEAFQQTACRT